jgi:hypothetical protein
MMSRKIEPKHTLFGSVGEMLAPESLAELTSMPVKFVNQQPISDHTGLAGSNFTKVLTNNGQFVLKEMSMENDWLMYSTDDVHCRSVTLWQYGLLDELLPNIEHSIIACARNGNCWAILMEDLSGKFFTWDTPMPTEQVPVFLDVLARLHAAFWNDDRLFDAQLGLCDTTKLLAPGFRALRHEDETKGPIPGWIKTGWEAVKDLLTPEVYSQVSSLFHDPSPIVNALNRYPYTLLHGDYRAENLAFSEHPVIIDWQQAGKSLMTIDLAWITKHGYVREVIGEAQAIAYYRNRLETHLGISFDEQEWQAMVELGYGIDALRFICFTGFFYAMDEDPQNKQFNRDWSKQHGQYVINALRWI